MAKAELVEYDHLIKTKKVEEDVNFEDIVNSNSRFPRLCYVEPNIRTLQQGSFVQFLRRGYYKVDQIHNAGADPVYEFIFTPDGKTKGIASIQTETDKKGDIKKENLEDKMAKKAEKIGKVEGEEAKEGKKEKKEKKKKEEGAAEGEAKEGEEKKEQPKKEKKEKKKDGKAPEAVTEVKTEEVPKTEVKEAVEVKVDPPAEVPK